MAAIPAGHALVTCQFSLTGSTRNAYNVFGVENAGVNDAEYIATNVRIDWSESLSLIQCESWSLTGVHVELATGAEFTDSTPVPGEQTENPDPPNTAFLYRKSTGIAGRDMRGRMYVVGVPSAWTDTSGSFGPTDYGAVNAAGVAFHGKLAADDIPMVLFHTASSTANEVISLTADSKVATQRRRLR